MPHMFFTTCWCVNTYSFTFNLDQLLIVDTKFWHTPNRPSQHEPMLLGPKGSERVWHYKPNLSLKKNMHFCCISDRKNIWKNMEWETCLTLMIRFSSCPKKIMRRNNLRVISKTVNQNITKTENQRTKSTEKKLKVRSLDPSFLCAFAGIQLPLELKYSTDAPGEFG